MQWPRALDAGSTLIRFTEICYDVPAFAQPCLSVDRLHGRRDDLRAIGQSKHAANRYTGQWHITEPAAHGAYSKVAPGAPGPDPISHFVRSLLLGGSSSFLVAIGSQEHRRDGRGARTRGIQVIQLFKLDHFKIAPFRIRNRKGDGT